MNKLASFALATIVVAIWIGQARLDEQLSDSSGFWQKLFREKSRETKYVHEMPNNVEEYLVRLEELVYITANCRNYEHFSREEIKAEHNPTVQTEEPQYKEDGPTPQTLQSPQEPAQRVNVDDDVHIRELDTFCKSVLKERLPFIQALANFKIEQPHMYNKLVELQEKARQKFPDQMRYGTRKELLPVLNRQLDALRSVSHIREQAANLFDEKGTEVAKACGMYQKMVSDDHLGIDGIENTELEWNWTRTESLCSYLRMDKTFWLLNLMMKPIVKVVRYHYDDEE